MRSADPHASTAPRRWGPSLLWSALLISSAFLGCSSEDSATLSLSPTPNDSGETGGASGENDLDATAGSDSGEANGDEQTSDPSSCLSGCPEDFPNCLNGRCAECTDSSDCETEEMCELTTGLCRRACTTVDDCSGDEFCSPSGVCLECAIDHDCTSEDDAYCSDDGLCIECRSDDDCSGNEENVCDPVTAECVECLSDDDCSSESCDRTQRECAL